MTDRYQPLRDAIAAGAVLVVLKRPEGYEDVHPETLIDDAAIHRAFEPEHVGAELAALLKERDALLRALLQLAYIEPVRGVSPNALVGAATVEWNVHVIARAALAALNGDDHAG